MSDRIVDMKKIYILTVRDYDSPQFRAFVTTYHETWESAKRHSKSDTWYKQTDSFWLANGDKSIHEVDLLP